MASKTFLGVSNDSVIENKEGAGGHAETRGSPKAVGAVLCLPHLAFRGAGSQDRMHMATQPRTCSTSVNLSLFKM